MTPWSTVLQNIGIYVKNWVNYMNIHTDLTCLIKILNYQLLIIN